MTENSKFNTATHDPIRVYIAAGTVEEVERTAQSIRNAGDMSVAGIALGAADLEAAFKDESAADVLVTDIILKGVDMAPLLSRIKHRCADLDILVLSTQSQDPVVIRAILAGATGYILRDSQEDVVTSVRLLRGGGSPVSPMVARGVLRAIHARSLSQPHGALGAPALAGSPAPSAFTPEAALAQPQAAAAASPQSNLLSQRESEIIMLLAKGISFGEISNILGISQHTVTAHIKKIYKKLGVHSRGEAVYEATCMGLLTL